MGEKLSVGIILLLSFSTLSDGAYVFEDYLKCEEENCDQDLCVNLLYDLCDEACQEELTFCFAGDYRTGDVSEDEVEEQVERATEEVFRRLSQTRAQRKLIRRLTKSPLVAVDINALEKNHTQLIHRCANKIGKDASEYFISKFSPTTCQAYLQTGQFEDFINQPYCGAQWISLNNRAIFYEECLNLTDVNSLFKRATQQISLFEIMKRNVKQAHDDKAIGRVVGGAIKIAGGIAMGLGVLVPPLAPFAGTTLAVVTGGVTTLASTLLGGNKTQEEIARARQDFKRLENDFQEVVLLIGLYQQTIHHFELTKRAGLAAKIVEDQISSVLIQTAPAIAASTKVSAMITTKIAAKIATKIGAKSVGKVVGYSVAGKALQFVTGLIKKAKLPVRPVLTALSKFAAKETLKTVGKLILPVMSIGVGIWDVVVGSTSELDKGLFNKIELERRHLEKHIDDVIKIYLEMGFHIQGKEKGSTSIVSSIGFHINETSWGNWLSGKLRFEMKTQNKFGRNITMMSLVKKSQRTNFWSGKGWLTWNHAEDLHSIGDVYNDKVWIRILSDAPCLLAGSVSVDQIQIGLNGNFVPDLDCDIGNETMAASNGNSSRWAECKRAVGLKKIKTHTSTKMWSGTDDDVSIKIKVPLQDEETPFDCTTGYLDTAGVDDRERGQTDIYELNEQFGMCSNSKIASAIAVRNESMPIQISIIKTPYYVWDDAWTLDLLKLYFTLQESDQMVLSCALCNENDPSDPEYCGLGFGTTVESERKTHNCYKLITSPRSLEMMKIKTCDLTDASSGTDSLQMKICKVNAHQHESERCCMTNRFGGSFTNGQWTELDRNIGQDDGGDQLGQCEAFAIDGTEVEISLKNEGYDSVCLDEFQFYGAKQAGKTSSHSIPFITCNPTCDIWATRRFLGDEEGYCEGDAHWQNWGDVKATCAFVNNTATVKTIALKFCDDEGSETTSAIEAVIMNSDNQNCTTGVRDIINLTKGSYEEINGLGNCMELEIKEKIAKVWLVNRDPSNSLCLTDVYLDISSSSGETRMLQCQLNENESSRVFVLDNEPVGIPLVCK